MKKRTMASVLATVAAISTVLTACGTTDVADTSATNEVAEEVTETAQETSEDTSSTNEVEVVEESTTVIITDIYGDVEVTKNPERVVSFDNRTFETLEDWGIELVAAPKDVMPADSAYVADDNVINLGNHREPDFEALAAADPDLVIVGQRFASYYEEIKELVPNATVIDFSFNVSDAEDTGASLVEGLKNATSALGAIFEKDAEAQALNDEFDQLIADVNAAYNGTDTVLSVVVSGGEIGYSAPGNGRVWGPLYNVFGWVSAIEVDNTTSDHQGDDISIEAIASSNPAWIMVLDRDAAVASSDGQAASDVIENAPALANLTAIQEGHIVYAPNDTYTNESIQTFIELFTSIKEAFENAN